MVFTLIVRASDDDTDYIVPADEVEQTRTGAIDTCPPRPNRVRREYSTTFTGGVNNDNCASTIDSVHSGEFERSDTVANQAFGFWIYIMTDLVLFASIFATYAVVGLNYAGGPRGRISSTFAISSWKRCSFW